MLRTNLSTRPFYNERAVHLLLGGLALVLLAITVVNIVELVSFSRQNTVLSARIREDRTAADDLIRKARQTRQGINQDELKLVVAAAREANILIDGRTFSWTQLFNHLESTLPPDVMLTSIRPTIDDGNARISLTVSYRRRADFDEFMEKLEATGEFEDVLPRQEMPNDEGLIQATMEARYTPDAPPVPEAPAAPAVPPGPVKPVPGIKPAGYATGGAR